MVYVVVVWLASGVPVIVPLPVLKCKPEGNAGWTAHVATTPPLRFWRMGWIIASLVRTCVWLAGVSVACTSLIVMVTEVVFAPPELFA